MRHPLVDRLRKRATLPNSQPLHGQAPPGEGEHGPPDGWSIAVNKHPVIHVVEGQGLVGMAKPVLRRTGAIDSGNMHQLNLPHLQLGEAKDQGFAKVPQNKSLLNSTRRLPCPMTISPPRH